MAFPENRPRRLRRNPAIRALVRETTLTNHDLIAPLFVKNGSGVRNEIKSLPGQFHLSPDTATEEAFQLQRLGIQATILFGLPAQKDQDGMVSCDPDGPVQKTIRAIKKDVPGQLVIGDLCFCEYTSHGHCGVLSGEDVDNDPTIANLGRQAVSLAEAGADIIAPSGMMDGMVAAIRQDLDESGFQDVIIMSYAAKYASSFYGPFKEAADSAPQFGDRKTYQMDPANSDEALREVELDLEEGADIIMVKPALPYLDIIRRVRDTFPVPVAAYNVSGEYSMIKFAAAQGIIDGERVMLEVLQSIKRAGADMILTYFAKEAAPLLR